MTSYTHNAYCINIDLTRDSLLSEAGIALMKDRYLLKEYDNSNQVWINKEHSPQECFARAACQFASNQEHAQRLYNYVSKNWMMFATPILSNAGTNRGLPISCFLGQCDDSVKGILDHHYETGFLASFGGGVGGDWSRLRSDGTKTSRGNVSTGVIPFINMFDKQMLAFQQGSTRRGAYAAYMDISHPEVEEFIEIRKGLGKDLNRRCLGEGFHHALNIPDSFMQAVEAGGEWNLVEPTTKEVRKTVNARELWMKVLLRRLESGEPYLHFSDTSNRALPEFLKERGLRINNSNLCSEIMLPTAPDRTAVCCLSSVNLEYYDDWRDDNLFILDMLEMLDNVLQFFIDESPQVMWRAANSAETERSVGLGAMGFYLYLQQKGIPFESSMAVSLNRQIFSRIRNKADEANYYLGKERGEAPFAKGTGRRFSHTTAIAPNANISVICGNTSPSIEPYNANAFKQNTLSGTFLIKNKALDRVLKEHYNLSDNSLNEIWSSITVNKGSVQHLPFMSLEHKEIFKTALELDQMWIVEHAAHRQAFIDQGQSVNLFFENDVHKQLLHTVHYQAWKKGLKSLYYCRSTPARRSEVVTIDIIDQSKNNETDERETAMEYEQSETCVACEG